MIDINELTIGQARELAKMLSQPEQSKYSPHPSVGRYCVIRSHAAGVHVGTVAEVTDSASGREVRLHGTRRIWSWQGALSCTEISVSGVTGGKLSVQAEINFVNQVIEVLPCSKEAEECLKKFK